MNAVLALSTVLIAIAVIGVTCEREYDPTERKTMMSRLISQWPSGHIGAKKVRDMLGNGFNCIVYDCAKPKISVKEKKNPAALSAQMEEVKQNYTCNPKDSTWRRAADSAYVTYNTLSHKVVFFAELEWIKAFREKSLCNYYMSFLKHPWYERHKSVKKPEECRLEEWTFAGGKKNKGKQAEIKSKTTNTTTTLSP